MLKRIPELDGLRAIAILAVLVGHFPLATAMAPLASYGDTGVVLFFCLSGFLITRILIELKEREIGSGSKLAIFVTRRALRIFPIYYMTLAVCLVVGYGPVIDNWHRLITYTANYVPFLGWPPARLGQAAHLWSLSVEEQFYLLWPLVVLFFPLIWLRPLVLAIVVAAASAKLYFAVSGFNYGLVFRAVFSSMDSLGIGALLALSPRLRFPNATLPLVTALFVVMTAWRIWAGIDPWYLGSEWFGVIYFFVIIACSAALLDRATWQERWLLSPILGNAVMRYIGRISYGLYVYHFFMPLLVPNRPSIVWVATFAVAIASWHLIEQPILKLRDAVR